MRSGGSPSRGGTPASTVLALSPLEAGVAYLPFGAALYTGIAVASRSAGGRGLKPTLVVGLACTAVGITLLSLMSPDGNYAGDVLPGFLLAGAGMGISTTALAVMTTWETADCDIGVASGTLGTLQQLGSAVGLAILVPLAAWRTSGVRAEGEAPLVAYSAGLSTTLVTAAIVVTVGLALALSLPGVRVARPAGTGASRAVHDDG